MYLHIGGQYEIPVKLILGIFDVEETDALNPNSLMGQYLKNKEEEQGVELVELELPQTMIVTLEKVYLSPVTFQTIKSRLRHIEHRLAKHTDRKGMYGKKRV